MAGHDDERPKKSWSERDKAKNKPSHRKEERRGSDGGRMRETSREYRSYKTQLNKLFDGSGVVPEALRGKLDTVELGEEAKASKEARQGILDALTPRKILKAYRTYRESNEFPRDKAVLEKLLDLDDEDIVLETFATLDELFEEGLIKRASSLKMRIQAAQLAVDTRDVKERGDALLRKLR